ncbi:MAG: molybdopterin-dependent oxidoreductase, partial [Smithellaceae bacterium]|nr:molybdopterin-dependent oxidoreductase [Smithellaceae bacterium]
MKGVALRMSRRGFLKLGACFSEGLIIGMHFSSPDHATAADQPEAFVPNAFIRIGTDDTVTITVNKSEMGQGVYTSLPMLIAEELECDWRNVRVEPAPVAPVYNSQVWKILQATGGSTSVRSEWDRFRTMGASARTMLITAAAAAWGVDSGSCYAESGKVYGSSGRALRFGELVTKAAQVPIPEKVVLKDPSAFKILGKPRQRLDTPEKTNGTGIFGFDVMIPGMLTALIQRAPVFGGKAVKVNDTKTRAIPGVQDVIEVPPGVAVIAEGFWPAKKGRDVLEISWDEGEDAKLTTAELWERYRSMGKKRGLVARHEGDPDRVLQKAAIR